MPSKNTVSKIRVTKKNNFEYPSKLHLSFFSQPFLHNEMRPAKFYLRCFFCKKLALDWAMKKQIRIDSQREKQFPVSIEVGFSTTSGFSPKKKQNCKGSP